MRAWQAGRGGQKICRFIPCACHPCRRRREEAQPLPPRAEKAPSDSRWRVLTTRPQRRTGTGARGSRLEAPVRFGSDGGETARRSLTWVADGGVVSFFSGGRSPGSRSSSSQCCCRPERGAGERSALLTCSSSALLMGNQAQFREPVLLARLTDKEPALFFG